MNRDASPQDIEGWEWAALDGLAAEADAWPRHLRPAQIAFELHLLDRLHDSWIREHPGFSRAPGLPYCSRRQLRHHWPCPKPATDVHALMASLFAAGFLLIAATPNRHCGHCYELVVAQIGAACAAAR